MSVSAQHRHALLPAILAGVLACLLTFGASSAMAADAPEADDAEELELTELQQRVEASAQAYNEAQANLASLQEQIAANQQQIDEINASLPAMQNDASDALKVLFMVQQEGGSLVDIILGSESLNEFLRNVEYLDVVYAHNAAQVKKLSDSKAELERAQQQLDEAATQAAEEAERAGRALEQAKAVRQEAEEKAAAIAAQQAAEAAARAAEEAARAEAAQQASMQQQSTAAPAEAGQDAANPEVDTSAQDTSGAVDGSVSAGEVDWSADKTAFVDQWAGRIDSYLAGTALSGTGRIFAEAAWDYGVDPRWSPAISYVESSCGAACFRPHNAWGWGSSSWGSWEEAIPAHVSGLARVYGSTLTVEAAKKYCPPSYTSWYNNVLAQMNQI